MIQSKTNLSAWKTRTKKTVIQLAIWTGSWVATFAVARFGIEFIWDSNQILPIAAVLLNLGIGIGMILANIQYLKVLDEMMQKIQLEAMGLSLGIGVVAGLSFVLLDRSNIITFDTEIAHLVILIALSYLGSVIIGYRKYR